MQNLSKFCINDALLWHIMQHSERRVSLMSLVKWKDFGIKHNTWEPWDNVYAPDLVADFYRKYPSASVEMSLPRRVGGCKGTACQFNANQFNAGPKVHSASPATLDSLHTCWSYADHKPVCIFLSTLILYMALLDSMPADSPPARHRHCTGFHISVCIIDRPVIGQLLFASASIHSPVNKSRHVWITLLMCFICLLFYG